MISVTSLMIDDFSLWLNFDFIFKHLSYPGKISSGFLFEEYAKFKNFSILKPDSLVLVIPFNNCSKTPSELLSRTEYNKSN